VRAEADHADRAERQEAEHGRHRHSPALTPMARREHDERQHQAGRDLHADSHHQRSRGRAKARARAGAQGQRRREHHQHQRVVVRAADRQHEQHRVEPDECRRPSARLPEPARRARDERDRAEAGGNRHGFERPQAAGQAERRSRVAGQREQRPVGRVLVGPAEEIQHFVARRLRGHVRVRVQAVQRAQPGEAEIPEHVLGDQRRPEQQQGVGGDDRRDDRAHRQRARKRQHEQVARAHDQRQRLKAAPAERHAQALQRPGHPAGPAAAAPRHVLRRFAGGARHRQEDRHDDAQQADQAERARRRGGTAGGWVVRGPDAGLRAASGLGRRAGQGRSGRHRLIVTSSAQAGVWCAM